MQTCLLVRKASPRPSEMISAMARLDEIDERVVEIRLPLQNGSERRGSGIVISPCRILTALHVIVGDVELTSGQPTVAPPTVKVRSLGDLYDHVGDVRNVNLAEATRIFDERAGGDYRWLEASLIWPNIGSKAPRLELAILGVPNCDGFRVLKESAPLKVAEAIDGEECRALGFPFWASRALSNGKVTVDTSVIHATIKRGSAIYSSMSELHVSSGSPDDREKWRGMSGSALINQSKSIVGIISLAKDASNNDLLAATLLADAALDENFDLFWHSSGVIKPHCIETLNLPDETAPEKTIVEFVKRFPIGPPLSYESLPRSIRDRIMKITNPLATLIILNANQIRSMADPELNRNSIIIRPVGTIGELGEEVFWLKTLNQATLAGPRTVVSLLVCLPASVRSGLETTITQYLLQLISPT